MNSEFRLGLTTWTLRLMGAVLCLAIFPVFFPLSWMAELHDKLLPERLPGERIFEYLARSLSAMYFAHGVIVLTASTNVLRYLPLVRVLGILNIALGLLFLGIDLAAGMPNYWMAAEGPSIAAGGACLLLLVRAITADSKLKH